MSRTRIGRLLRAGTRRAWADCLLEGAWLSLAILVPLAINPWGDSIFSLPKAALLRAVVLTMIAALAVDALWGQRKQKDLLERWRGVRQPLLIPAVALSAVICLATIFAADRTLSLWGSYERSLGALTLLCLPLLGVLVAARLRSPAAAERLLWVLTLSVLPLAAYAVVQLLGPDPLGITTDARSRVFATLGRANFLSAYAAMLLPLSLTLWRLTMKSRLRSVVGTTIVLEVALLIVTQTRSGLLAALVAMACWAALSWRRRLGPRLTSSAARWGWAVLAAGLAGALWFAHLGGSGAARLAVWQGVQKLIAARPLLGYGPDALELVFPKVYPPELVYYQGRGMGTDRAHNLILDWTATLGLLGLFAGAAVLFVVTRAGWRVLSQSPANCRRELLVVGALSALSANAAGTMISFDVIPTLVCSWLLAGMVVGLATDRDADRVPDVRAPAPTVQPEARSNARRVPLAVATALIGLGFCGALYYFSVRPILADVFAHRASQLAAGGHWDSALAASQNSVDTFPEQPLYKKRYGWIHLQMALTDQPEPGRHLAEAQRLFLEATEQRPGDYLFWSALAEFHGAMTLHFDRRHLARSQDAWKQAVALAPNYGVLYLAWGRLLMQAGDPSAAIPLLRKAVDLDDTDVEAWLLLGDSEVLRNPAAALVMYRQAAKHTPTSAGPIVGLARAYWMLGQPELARRTAREALDLEEGNPSARRLLEEFSAYEARSVSTNPGTPPGPIEP